MNQEELKVNMSPSEEVQSTPGHQFVPKPSSTDNATFTIDDNKSSQPEPTTTTSLSPKVVPDATVNNDNETCDDNPCSVCRISLGAGIRWVFGFGMFMSAFYAILCHYHGCYEEKHTPKVLLSLGLKDKEQRGPGMNSREICLHFTGGFSILCFTSEFAMMFGSKPREKIINSYVASFWLVSTIFCIILTIALVCVIGISMDFLTPLESYKSYKVDDPWIWADNYNEAKFKEKENWKQERIQQKHTNLYIMAVLELTFAPIFIVIRVWFIAIVRKFKKEGFLQRYYYLHNPASQGQDGGTLVAVGACAPPMLQMFPYRPHFPHSHYGFGHYSYMH